TGQFTHEMVPRKKLEWSELSRLGKQELGIRVNEEKFGTYEAIDGYAIGLDVEGERSLAGKEMLFYTT
ncbi:hypothetical protein Tco_0070532, partial [Tanacetum coccineum]